MWLLTTIKWPLKNRSLCLVAVGFFLLILCCQGPRWSILKNIRVMSHDLQQLTVITFERYEYIVREGVKFCNIMDGDFVNEMLSLIKARFCCHMSQIYSRHFSCRIFKTQGAFELFISFAVIVILRFFELCMDLFKLIKIIACRRSFKMTFASDYVVECWKEIKVCHRKKC